MKSKANKLIIILVAALAVTLVLLLAGCDGKVQRADAAERIQVEDTHVYMSPSGDPSVYTLKPIVYPIETASQSVYYTLADNSDKKYLTVGADGVLQAKGELKQDEDGNNLDIVVRIISAATSKVTLDITVTIEVVEVQRILFAESTQVVELTGKGIQLNPIFEPAHALTGRNVLYSSDDENIATVDVNGFVRPTGIGKVAIWVETPKQGAFGDQKRTHVTIDVRYSSLNYRLDLTTGLSTLRQISGYPEEISFVLSQLDENCDPSPSISWYVNTTPIDGVGVKDSKVLKYDPSALPIGEYHIRAVLDNSTQRQELISDTITVYGPLTDITLDVLNDDTNFVENDNINLLITYAERVYPPESYVWSITYTDLDNNVYVEDPMNLPPAKQESYLVKPDLSYMAKGAGKYEISAEAIVKGVSSGIKTETKVIYVGERALGNDITGLYMDGAKAGGEVHAMLSWDPLPYETDYVAEIAVGQTVTTLTSTENGDYFRANGVCIPATIATLEQSFSVRVKSSRFNAWTDWFYYQGGSIKIGAYNYFNEIAGGYNAYIANMRELGNLLDYLAVFRPSELLTAEGIYRLVLYIPFTYDSLPEGKYPISSNDIATAEQQGYSEAEMDSYKILIGALAPYVESTRMSCGIGRDGCVLNGVRTLLVKFLSEGAPSGAYAEVGAAKEVNSYTHYTDTPRALDADLPIDSLQATVSVATSNQLYLAVAMGKRPVPVTGSAAERIYNRVRQVLCLINGDDSTDKEKVLAIYEWLSANVTYDYAIAGNQPANPYIYNSFYLEGVFDDGLAVCDGYAKAFTLMCGMEGIPTYRICGYEKSGGVAHAWNAVLLDGLYYVVDTTWSNYKFALVNEEGESLYEIISYGNLALGDSEAQRSHYDYGEYVIAEGKGLSYAYNISIGNGYDTEIDSDAELVYVVKNYLPSILGDSEEIWIELKLEDAYLYSKGGTTGYAENPETIKGIIKQNIPSGYDVLTLDGSGSLFVGIRKNG